MGVSDARGFSISIILCSPSDDDAGGADGGAFPIYFLAGGGDWVRFTGGATTAAGFSAARGETRFAGCRLDALSGRRLGLMSAGA